VGTIEKPLESDEPPPVLITRNAQAAAGCVDAVVITIPPP
jgi:hypothetical protein